MKVGNSLDKEQTVSVTLKGAKKIATAKQTLLKANPADENSLQAPNKVVPQTNDLTLSGNAVNVTLPAKSFSVIVVE